MLRTRVTSQLGKLRLKVLSRNIFSMVVTLLVFQPEISPLNRAPWKAELMLVTELVSQMDMSHEGAVLVQPASAHA